jgi:hypothetical protein
MREIGAAGKNGPHPEQAKRPHGEQWSNHEGRTNTMTDRRLGIIMNGVTGRMGTVQHLVRSVLAIRAEGGLRLANGDRVMPDPILVGRNAEKLAALAKAHGIARTTTDLDRALAAREDTVYFDAVTTGQRKHNVDLAISEIGRASCRERV